MKKLSRREFVRAAALASAAAPLATSYSTTTAFHGPNTFLRFDHHLNGNNQLSFRWTREAIITERDADGDHRDHHRADAGAVRRR